MTIDIGCLVVSEGTPSGSISSEPGIADWLWFKPSTGMWHKVNPSTGSWEEVAVPSHAHATLGNINFTGSISVGGAEGLSVDITEARIRITHIKIVNGLITELVTD